MKIFMNGQLVDEADAKVSVFDHGLLYGDGVFEGIRIYNGRVFMLEEHVERLYDSSKAICLDVGMSPTEMIDAVVKTCLANGLTNGYIRLLVTRGKGTLGLNPFLCENASVIVIAADIQLYPEELYEEGLKLVTLGTTRNIPEALNPRIKSLNYLNNVMGKIEAINSGVMEGIMLNAQGYVAEATGDNIFALRKNKLVTPPSWCGALEGITRNKCMELAEEMGLDVREDVVSRYDLYTADEVFLTGTAAEIIAVTEIDSRTIGAGTPGETTRELEKRFRAFANNNGTPIV